MRNVKIVHLELFGAQDRHDVESGDAAGGGPDTCRRDQSDEQNREGGRSEIDGFRPINQAFKKTSAEHRSGDSRNRPRRDSQQALPQQDPPKSDRSSAESQAYTHFVGPLNNSIGNDAVNADHREQQRESREKQDGGAVESRTGEGVSQALRHRFHTEYGNLRVHRPDRVADHTEVIFSPAIHSRHEGREKTTRRVGWDEHLSRVCVVYHVVHPLDDADNLPACSPA